MRKEEIVTELVNSVDRNGFVTTLYGVFGKSVKVSISQ